MTNALLVRVAHDDAAICKFDLSATRVRNPAFLAQPLRPRNYGYESSTKQTTRPAPFAIDLDTHRLAPTTNPHHSLMDTPNITCTLMTTTRHPIHHHNKSILSELPAFSCCFNRHRPISLSFLCEPRAQSHYHRRGRARPRTAPAKPTQARPADLCQSV